MSCFRVPLHNNPGEADDIKNLVIMKRLLAAADQGTLCRLVLVGGNVAEKLFVDLE